MSGRGDAAITPELALVDPDLAQAQRQANERKVTMSSDANGMFFTDQAPAAPAPDPAPAPAPAAPGPLSPALENDPTTNAQNVPLGTLIFRAGLVAESQLEEALELGMRTGKRLGEVLLERGWINDHDLGRMLALQKGLGFVQLSDVEPDPEALERLPEEKAKLQLALPLRLEGEQLVVAVADPSNDLMLENLRRSVGHDPQLVVAALSDLKNSIGEAYAKVSSAEQAAPQTQEVPPEEQPSLQPAAPTVPEPMPTVVPPPEERNGGAAPDAPSPPEQPPLQPVAQEQPVAPEQPSVQQEPSLQQPVVEPALEAAAPPAAPAEQVAPPAEPESPAVTPPVESEVDTHTVVVQLQDGEHLDIGSFGSAEQARARAQEIVQEITASEGEATWPFLGERFLRPSTILSVDVVAHESERWGGSAARSRWAHEAAS